MERGRRVGLVALAAACLLLGVYMLWLESPEDRVLELVVELGQAGGLSGKAAPPLELREKLERALAREIELSAENGRERVDRESLIESLLVVALERQGVYSLYDLRAEVRELGDAEDQSVRAEVRGRLAPRDMRNELQGLDARAFKLELHQEGEEFVIDAVELAAPSVIEPEARP